MPDLDNPMLNNPAPRDHAEDACECGQPLSGERAERDPPECITCELQRVIEERDEAQRLLAVNPTSLAGIGRRLQREFPKTYVAINIDIHSHPGTSAAPGEVNCGLNIWHDAARRHIKASSIDHAIASLKSELEMAQADCDVSV